MARARFGTDEAGKGDYFGPLVVAGVAVRDDADEAVVAALGARDSKELTDRRADDLADKITRALPAGKVVIGPGRYNDLYSRLGNLNLILAWAHARVLEDLAAAHPTIRYAVADKFGDESYITRALMAHGRRLDLDQRVKGEADLAVAAASIVARAEFLRRLNRLSAAAGLRLPKGAAAQVDEAGRRLVAMRGAEVLTRYAKVHFRNTARVLS